jgi:hypothetical protein
MKKHLAKLFNKIISNVNPTRSFFFSFQVQDFKEMELYNMKKMKECVTW